MGHQTKLLPPPPLAELAAQASVALFLDFDGTLVPIASGPDAIEVPGGLAGRLEALALLLSGRLALVSGRSLEDLSRHVGDPAIYRAGSHGAARQKPGGTWLGEPPKGLPSAAINAIQEFATLQDIHFEPKSHGAALHFRARPELAGQALGFAQELAGDHGLQIKQGKCVVELVRPGAGKDLAVRVFMAEAAFAGATPIFLGDDVTDEDGFLAATDLGGFGIAVGERISSNARYHLEDVKDVHEWLKL